MNISKVETIRIGQPTTEFYERDALAVVGGAEHPMDIAIVKVETSKGEVGYGECVSYGGLEPVAVSVEKVLGPLIKGEESSTITHLWDKMYMATFRLGRRGVMISAMSGVDIALWDLLGKELGAPVYKLIGGADRRVKGYVTGGYYRSDKDLAKLVEEERSYLRAGFDTVKMKIGALPIAQDVKRIKSVKDAFGDKIHVAVDANNTFNFNSALRMGRELEKLGVEFFEEPIPTDHPELSAELARSLDVPVAGYETAYTLYEYRDFIEKHAVDIVQNDAAWNGGITEMLRIGVLARAHGLPVIPHYSAGGIGFVASLHAALAMNSPMIEYHLRPNPFRDGLAGEAIRHEKGEFLPPKKPGLGISPDDRIIEKYRVK
ncbi:MAG: mandelate racemase/muconate lactonizing enzyme family protein [Nitrososphaerota archaeon]|jgi:D-arabinonate dehydratase|nr:mandelate racemase/muconate lactonizing enzyme family protein [Nitrososphaerota archaeon]MDG6943086.1 mandelate racemase/muconate lactonizing enzyme family protein [Nitrososphaerota archaeon]